MKTSRQIASIVEADPIATDNLRTLAERVRTRKIAPREYGPRAALVIRQALARHRREASARKAMEQGLQHVTT